MGGEDDLNQPSRTGKLAVYLFLYIPVVWAALLIAQSLDGGLPQIITNLTAAMKHPFRIRWTDHSLVTILVCTGIYIMALSYLSANQGRTRDGEEHGSAAWATPRQVNAMFAQKQNKLLTKNVRLGLDIWTGKPDRECSMPESTRSQSSPVAARCKQGENLCMRMEAELLE